MKSWKALFPCCVSFVLLVFMGSVFAQDLQKVKQGSSHAKRETIAARKVKFNELMSHARPKGKDKTLTDVRYEAAKSLRDDKGYVRAMGAPKGGVFVVEGMQSAKPEEIGQGFLTQWRGLFMEDVPDLEFEKGSHIEHRGHHYLRYRQTYQGVEVMGAGVVVVVDPAQGVKFTGGGLMHETGGLSESRARANNGIGRVVVEQRARQWMKDKYPELRFRVSETKLVVFCPDLYDQEGEPRWAWYMEVCAVDNSAVNSVVVVDAESGKVLHHHFLTLNDMQYEITDLLPEPDITYDNDATTTEALPDEENENHHCDVWLLARYLEDTYDFYSQFECIRDGETVSRPWLSWDGDDGKIIATVRAGISTGGVWTYDNEMQIQKGYVTDDIVGHEFTHGVVLAISGLDYSGESAQIHEALADIFGEYIDLSNNEYRDPGPNESIADDDGWAQYLNEASGDDAWIHAEDVMVNPARPSLRSLKDPYPYSDLDIYDTPDYYSATDPHVLSGVGRKLGYLLSMDVEDLEIFNGIEVRGLGVDLAPELFFQSILMFSETTKYYDWGVILLCAAEMLEFSPSQYESVYLACQAVNILSEDFTDFIPRIYVSPSGDDNNQGGPTIVDLQTGAFGPWDNAVQSLGEGLVKAVEHQSAEIWVAAGDYGQQGSVFQLPESIALYGGFDGDEDDISQRNLDLELNPTTIHGSIQLIEYTGKVTALSWDKQGYFDQYINSNYDETRIDGCVVDGIESGGGDGIVSISKDNSLEAYYLTLSNCKIQNWDTGIYLQSFQYLNMIDCDILDCDLFGLNLIYIDNDDWPQDIWGNEIEFQVVDCIFSNCGVYGAQIYSSVDSQPAPRHGKVTYHASVRDCTFSGNGKSDDALYRGGLCILSDYVDEFDATVVGCDFYSNSGDCGAGLYVGEMEEVSIEACNFIGNNAFENSALEDQNEDVEDDEPENIRFAKGGGLYVGDSDDVTIQDCTFIGNSAGRFGGGVSLVRSGDVVIARCDLNTNTVTGDNVSEYNDRLGQNWYSWGGGLSLFDCGNVKIWRCSIANNEVLDVDGVAGGGEGISISGLKIGNDKKVGIYNTSFIGNRSQS